MFSSFNLLKEALEEKEDLDSKSQEVDFLLPGAEVKDLKGWNLLLYILVFHHSLDGAILLTIRNVRRDGRSRG